MPLANKADVNAEDNDALTPLFYAAREDQQDVAEFLRQHLGEGYCKLVDLSGLR